MIINITGNRYGKLTVISDSGLRDKASRVKWNCLCDCGKVVTRARYKLEKGEARSCGCARNDSKIDNIVGNVYNRLTVIAINSRNNGVIWDCLCVCGKVTRSKGRDLKSGKKKSCGCYNEECKPDQLKRKHGLSSTRVYRNAVQGKRRASKLLRTPKWSNIEDINVFYQNCPKGCDVDHIVPLQGKNVSGLHVLNNLQYLDSSENSRKYNKFEAGEI